MNIAIVGATGLVGQEMIRILESTILPVDDIGLFASQKSIGKKFSFRNRKIAIQALAPDSFTNFDYALFSAGTSVSKEFAPKAIQQKCVVIDNSKAFRMENDIPLIVPEINSALLREKPMLIANPNCSTIQMVVALKPVYDFYGIEQIIVSTYQAVSGTGKDAVNELEKQSIKILKKQNAEPNIYPYQIAFNCIPHIDKFQSNGFTTEEMKLVNETKKILGDNSLKINATAVRVPVFIGHAESIFVRTKNAIQIDKICDLMNQFEGIKVVDNVKKNKYPMQIETEKEDKVLVGRLRADLDDNKSFTMWVTANNIRKGAALNAVQILEKYINL